MNAVYQYPDWQEVYRHLFPGDAYDNLALPELEPDAEAQEPDGNNPKGGGEGEEHRRLREWVLTHPELINPDYQSTRTATEWLLKSGDRVDVAVFLPYGKTVAVEVKSRVSNDSDLERGVYQCIKYRAVIDAMGMDVTTVLLTECELPSHLRSISRAHDILNVQVRRHGRGFVVLPR